MLGILRGLSPEAIQSTYALKAGARVLWVAVKKGLMGARKAALSTACSGRGSSSVLLTNATTGIDADLTVVPRLEVAVFVRPAERVPTTEVPGAD